jgi:hypothetical protein
MKSMTLANLDTTPLADPRDQEDRLADLAQEIREGIEEDRRILWGAWEKGKARAVRVGFLLIEAKALVKEQGLNWIPWVEDNCCDERAAQRYMRIAANQDDPRLIAAEEDAKAHGRALYIEEADKALRRTTAKRDKNASKPIEGRVHRHMPKGDPNPAASTNLSGPVVEANQQDGEGDEDDQDAQIEAEANRDEERLRTALATIKDILFGDRWETLREVIDALGLDWVEVVRFAQQQAEWAKDGGETSDQQGVEADGQANGSTDAPTTAANDLNGPTPQVKADESPTPESQRFRGKDGDEDVDASGQANGSMNTTTAANTSKTANTVVDSQTYADDGDRESACPDHGTYPDEDGLCVICGHKADGPPPMIPRKKKRKARITPRKSKTKNTASKKPNAKNSGKTKPAKETQSGRRSEGEDLASYVTAVLTREKGGVKLDDIVRKVLRDGYKTQSQNLGQAVYNVLSRLKKEEKVEKDDETKLYFLKVAPNPTTASEKQDAASEDIVADDEFLNELKSR